MSERTLEGRRACGRWRAGGGGVVGAVGVGVVLLAVWAGCSGSPGTGGGGPTTEIKRFALDSLDGVVTRSGVVLDAAVSSDGGGSLRIEAAEPRVVRLFEVGDVDIDNARLIYRAKLRTEDVKGQVYLEMWCRFPEMGEFFSRGLERPLSGTVDWTTEEISFFLQKGQKPDLVKLNLVIKGEGVAWIDDVRLLRGPLS
jgi:hypothetical protein